MHLILLFMTWAHAAKDSFCAEDFSAYPLRAGGTFINSEQYLERAVRPGLLRVQDDLCRCMPRAVRNRPALVKANLHADPNAGEMRVEYIVDSPWSRPVRRMMKCMGEPMLRFEPIHYVSDIIYTDGREEVFPHYPVRIELNNNPVRKGLFSRKK